MGKVFSELRRRNVFRVGLAYLVVAWLLLQVTDVVVPMLGLPDWTAKLIFLLLAIGLVPAIILAWAYELTPDGVKLEKHVDREASVTHKTRRKLDFIIIGLLAIALVYFVYESRLRESPAGDVARQGMPAARSIAVLPFINIGNDERNEYLSDGLAETLLHMLAQIEELQVAARTSAFKFKGTNEDVRLIGEQLGVATVLEGSVQRAGDTIRITAQLIDVGDGFHLWSENYERTLDDIFEVQDDIASSVVDALQLELLGPPQARGAPTPQAYDALLKIREDIRDASEVRVAAAISAAESLIAAYPGYADAHAALSEALAATVFSYARIPEGVAQRSIDVARTAVELAPESARAQAAFASALLSDRQYIQVVPVIERALELEPGNADLMAAQVDVLQSLGRFREALAMAERAIARDPLNDQTRITLALNYYWLGRFEDTIATLQAGLLLEPGNPVLRHNLGLRYANLGRFPDAVDVLQSLVEQEPGTLNAWQTLFYLYFNLGDQAQAELYLEHGESISESRLADERAIFCMAKGDTECWYAATDLQVATREQFFAQIWQSRMLRHQGRLDEAIEVLLPWIEHFDATDDPYGNPETQINLASLYHLAGDERRRDELLAGARERIERGLHNGGDSWEFYYLLGMAAAAAGDADGATDNLDKAYERRFRWLWWLVQDYAWDPVRESEGFKAVIRRIEADNAAMLEQVRAAGRE